MNDYLSKPDGNILGFLQDPRVWATAIGAAAIAFLEKQIFPLNRSLFGYAVEADGTMIFVDQAAFDAAGKGQRLTQAANKQNLMLNRQLARVVVIGVLVGVIEFTKKGDPKFIANLQYVCLGGAAVEIARILQDFFPVLVSPGRK